jgi:hypothetical protein
MKHTSNAVRFSATLPQDLHHFLEMYQHNHTLASRSAALAEAITALREREMLRGYQELGQAQAQALEVYPPDLLDGLDTATEQDSQQVSKWL